MARVARAAAVKVEVRALDRSLEADFSRVHDACDGGGCWCVAWWVPTWDGWGERGSDENRRLREELFRRGEHDGFLAYVDGEPAAWCQAGPRDRLEKLARELELAPDPEAWAVTCFLVRPDLRRRGVATTLLARVVERIRDAGARRVEAFPKRGDDLDELALWNGPRTMFAAAGFQFVKEGAIRDVMALELA